jgi:transcriptional regulator with XRE-family HTH domain
MIMNEMLGSRIKALRNAKNFTQEQVAAQIGVSRQKYARIESGANSITLDILSKVAEVLGVTVGDITRVLDETPVVAYRAGEESGSSKKIFDMLDLFYANKHMCAKLQRKDIV